MPVRSRERDSMDARDDFTGAAPDKYAIGQPVSRKEDPTLVRGEGRYTDDINWAGQAYAVVVRSTVAHGIIRNIDVTMARTMPGVLAVYTADDLEGHGYQSLKCIVDFPNRDGSPMRKPERKALARDKVRFVGDPVALVVAGTRRAAEDAADT